MDTTMTITNVTFEDVLTVVGHSLGLLKLVASGFKDEYAFFWKDRHGQSGWSCATRRSSRAFGDSSRRGRRT